MYGEFAIFRFLYFEMTGSGDVGTDSSIQGADGGVGRMMRTILLLARFPGPAATLSSGVGGLLPHRNVETGIVLRNIALLFFIVGEFF